MKSTDHTPEKLYYLPLAEVKDWWEQNFDDLDQEKFTKYSGTLTRLPKEEVWQMLRAKLDSSSPKLSHSINRILGYYFPQRSQELIPDWLSRKNEYYSLLALESAKRTTRSHAKSLIFQEEESLSPAQKSLFEEFFETFRFWPEEKETLPRLRSLFSEEWTSGWLMDWLSEKMTAQDWDSLIHWFKNNSGEVPEVVLGFLSNAARPFLRDFGFLVLSAHPRVGKIAREAFNEGKYSIGTTLKLHDKWIPGWLSRRLADFYWDRLTHQSDLERHFRLSVFQEDVPEARLEGLNIISRFPHPGYLKILSDTYPYQAMKGALFFQEMNRVREVMRQLCEESEIYFSHGGYCSQCGYALEKASWTESYVFPKCHNCQETRFLVADGKIPAGILGTATLDAAHLHPISLWDSEMKKPFMASVGEVHILPGGSFDYDWALAAIWEAYLNDDRHDLSKVDFYLHDGSLLDENSRRLLKQNLKPL